MEINLVRKYLYHSIAEGCLMYEPHRHLVLVLVLQSEVISFNQIEVSTHHLKQNLACCSLLKSTHTDKSTWTSSLSDTENHHKLECEFIYLWQKPPWKCFPSKLTLAFEWSESLFTLCLHCLHNVYFEKHLMQCNSLLYLVLGHSITTQQRPEHFNID